MRSFALFSFASSQLALAFYLTMMMMMMMMMTANNVVGAFAFGGRASHVPLRRSMVGSGYTSIRMMVSSSSSPSLGTGKKKGKLLVLGGTGFLGQTICKRALLEGYEVTSLSRRGRPPDTSSSSSSSISSGNTSPADAVVATSASPVDYRTGDARQKIAISDILNEGGYTGVLHCIGLLLDDASGLGQFNALVSGSGSLPDANSTYDTITRLTAFNAIEASIEYAEKGKNNDRAFPFCFTSAAEAGWPDMMGGSSIEKFLAPGWLRRYLEAKRAVETKLINSQPALRPIIVRPSLIYSLDRPASYLPVGAFFVGNAVGLPFVDRPVTVQALACAMVRSMDRENVSGVQRYTQIDELSQ